MSWETVIGLEIHAQLSTKSKLFSGGSTEFGAESNTHVDLIDMGLPGCLLYTSPSPRDLSTSRMPSSA